MALQGVRGAGLSMLGSQTWGSLMVGVQGFRGLGV